MTHELVRRRLRRALASGDRARLVVGWLGVLATCEVFGSVAPALALVVAHQAWRTRPPTHGAQHDGRSRPA